MKSVGKTLKELVQHSSDNVPYKLFIVMLRSCSCFEIMSIIRLQKIRKHGRKGNMNTGQALVLGS